ncbi:hypothetical protein [Streptantibioticus cattleyicolor]|uniref:Uncharacterized protein n=1 Tax=Streptantibioticus cattleyicolor (strain ATCC 35852 / DSM 46488 / JCM 4925 / NBRC 14057 / NRRL 8057) TaxID=1003195 RepID=F8JKZ9_STREN|nr:hypothetical protein [Streptantibioticus cattleyicolor]AEW99640.1 hypothetical protein SCATT_p14470 [Streptantibioticus cattleyicolor NRRL 8057 = DSM 46488]CCB71321.1 Predicted protein [Streptantibioticus cattleyicolor NRRL 8057 = DSM 46488]
MAVVGTLLGSVITHTFQRLASKRNEQFTRSEALRQERIATYSAFAAAMEDYRRGQADRWYRKQEDPDGEAFVTARDEAHRLRTVARQALYRVKLLTDDRQAVLAAEQAYHRTRDMSNARDQTGWTTRDAEAKRAIEAFVSEASPLVR